MCYVKKRVGGDTDGFHLWCDDTTGVKLLWCHHDKYL